MTRAIEGSTKAEYNKPPKDKDKDKGKKGGESGSPIIGYRWPSDSPSGAKERKGGHR